jgi:hypothetical protein
MVVGMKSSEVKLPPGLRRVRLTLEQAEAIRRVLDDETKLVHAGREIPTADALMLRRRDSSAAKTERNQAVSYNTKREPRGISEAASQSVPNRLSELGLNAVTGIAILPENLFSAENREDLFFAPAATDFKVLLRQAGVTLDKIEPDGVKISFRDDRESTLFVPTLFLAGAYLSGYPNLVNLAIGVIANYVTDFFRGRSGDKRVNCTVILETTGKKTTKRIDYDGPPEEFGKLIDAIKKTIK